jgi:murein DD-endopeptidase MepM/ murein hydrolase activator NlpD
MGLIVDDAVAEGTPSELEPRAASAGAAPLPTEVSPLAAPVVPEGIPSPPAPPPDQSDLLESEPLATSAAHLLNTTSRPPPPEPSWSALPADEPTLARRASAPPDTPTPGATRASQGRISPAPGVPRATAAPRSAPEASSAPAQFARTGHPVRDRLLARATAAAPVPEPQLPSASFAKGEPLPAFSALDAFGDELDEIAAPKPSGAPIRIAGATLSSASLLTFGTILGLAVVASLFTLLIEFAPRGEQPAPAAAPVAPALNPVVSAQAPAPALLPPPERKRAQGPWRIPAAGPGQKRIEGDIGRDPFLKAIQAAGVSTSEAYRVYAALKEEKNLDRCRPKDHFIALLDRASGRLTAFEYVVNKEEIYQAREGKDGLLKGAKLNLEVKKERVQGSLILSGGTFDDAARAAHLEPSLDDIVNKALDGHTSIQQFQRGDRLRLVAQEVTVLGEFSRYAGIEALEYVPVNGKPLRIYYYPARKRYYDGQGRAPGEGGWRRPVKGAPITSKFNPNRLHPILKKRMPHTGTDFGAPTGTPVYAASYGVITKLGAYGANGNFIAIQHDHGYETGYSHLSRFEAGLKVGDKVSRMQVIGYVGSTGRSTGPHLHFSAKKDQVFIDPESLHMDALTVLPPSERSGFAQVRAQYEALLEAVPLLPPLNEPVAAPVNSAPAEMDLEAGEGEDPAAAGAGVVAPDPGEEVDGESEPMPAAPGPAVAAAPVQPAQLPLLPVPTPQPGQAPRSGAAFYLSDKELMESQAAVDEGEVER